LRTAGAALHNLGLILENLGQYPEAKEAFENSLRIMERTESRYGIASNMLHLGHVSKFLGNVSQAEEQLLCSLEIWRQMGNPSMEDDVLEYLGHLYLDTGRFDGAERYYAESQRIRESLDDKAGIAVCLNRRGELAILRAAFAAARPLLWKALQIREEIHAEFGLLSSWNYLSLLHLQEGNLEEAHRYALLMAEGARRLESESQEAWSMCRLGQVALAKGDQEAAAGYFQDARNLMRDNQNLIESIGIMCELASANLSMKNNAEAEELAREALRLGEKISRPTCRTLARRTLAGALWDRGERAEARRNYREALAEFEALDIPQEIARTQGEWGQREWTDGDQEVALDLLGQAQEAFRIMGAQQDLLQLTAWKKTFAIETAPPPGRS
jgi:tetratricopeptide (TPR) repeat protein